MVSIKDINKKIKKNLFDPLDTSKNKFSSFLKNIKKNKVKNLNDVFKSKYPLVTFSNKMRKFDNRIKNFLRKKMYYHKNVISNTNKGKKIIKRLFFSIQKNPNKYINVSKYDKTNIARSICDFIAGMTDRYAINLYKKIK